MKKVKFIIIFLLIIILVLQMTVTYAKTEGINGKQTSMYLWGINEIDYTTFDKVVNYLNINTIYVGRTDTSEERDLTSKEYEALFAYAKEKELVSYIVYDEKYAEQDENLVKIKELIDQVDEYNKTSEYKVCGIAIDSEFHTIPEYEQASQAKKVEMYEDYVESMQIAYEYAKIKNLKYVACIPTWYDLLDVNQTEKLIKDACDYVQIMNYEKANMDSAIDKEVELAKKYNKPIENIAELQKTGPNGVTEEITFYDDGIEACNEKFDAIDKKYEYEKLSFCYHFYNPLLELLDGKLDEKTPLTFSVDVTADKVVANLGDEITVTAKIDEISKNDFEGIVALTGKLEYDTNVLEIDLSSIKGVNDWNFSSGDYNPENFKFVVERNGFASEVGDIFEIKFKVKEEVELGETLIKLTSVEAGTAENKNGTVKAENAELKITVEEKTVTRLKGDLDNNGDIDGNDLALMKLHCIELKMLEGEDFEVAKMDNDDDVDINDLAILKMVIIGIIKCD